MKYESRFSPFFQPMQTDKEIPLPGYNGDIFHVLRERHKAKSLQHALLLTKVEGATSSSQAPPQLQPEICASLDVLVQNIPFH